MPGGTARSARAQHGRALSDDRRTMPYLGRADRKGGHQAASVVTRLRQPGVAVIPAQAGVFQCYETAGAGKGFGPDWGDASRTEASPHAVYPASSMRNVSVIVRHASTGTLPRVAGLKRQAFSARSCVVRQKASLVALTCSICFTRPSTPTSTRTVTRPSRLARRSTAG
ncbi:hypothetical protein WR25_12942 [Diploscapter pachys]|uniref:Uncharacterized protein n=1 Tax=Diploscapter pachys TaxID=2018661 RepID=A0A2A2M1W9_9BILA|nr:hypothetical protein WR25_12942 [Diploscapter pachys]